MSRELEKELRERLEREVERLRERARMNDRAADTSANADAKPFFAQWAIDERQRADDIAAVLVILGSAHATGAA